MIHTDGSTSERNKDNFKFNPFDMPAAHIFKIGADGKVHEIEAVGFVAPYNSATGWETVVPASAPAAAECSPRDLSRGRCSGR